MKLRQLIFVGLTAVGCGVADCAEISPKNYDDPYAFVGDAQALAFGPKVAIPIGYYELCKKGAPICELVAENGVAQSGGVVHLSRKLAGQLVTVNKKVNASIRSVSDKAQHGVADRWSVSPKAGDCEDFALTKKARLTALGWPSSALLIALATTDRGVEHAVLIVRTDRGALVLDNLVPNVRGFRPELYRWDSVQSPTDKWVWNKIETGGALVASNEPLPDDIVDDGKVLGRPGMPTGYAITAFEPQLRKAD